MKIRSISRFGTALCVFGTTAWLQAASPTEIPALTIETTDPAPASSVPEPSNMLLAGIGGNAVLLLAFRRK